MAGGIFFCAVPGHGGKSWTNRKVNDDASCATHMKPTATLDPKTGDLLVLWADNRDGKLFEVRRCWMRTQ